MKMKFYGALANDPKWSEANCGVLMSLQHENQIRDEKREGF